MKFVTKDELNIYWENSEDESKNPRRTATSPKIIIPKITTPVVNISTTQEPEKSAINITEGQLQCLKNKLLGKLLAYKS